MKVKDYEKNLRKIELRSEKPKKTICWASGSAKKTYYDDERVDVIERLLQKTMNSLFIEGYLTNETKVSVGFRKSPYCDNVYFEINFEVLK